MMQQANQFPAGALVRACDICRHPKTGRPGLLPITRVTWYRWVRAGKVPPGRRIGENVVAWPLEQVLGLEVRAQ